MSDSQFNTPVQKIANNPERMDKMFDQMVNTIMDSGMSQNEALQIMGRLMVATSMSLGMGEMSVSFANQSRIDISIPDSIMDEGDVSMVSELFGSSDPMCADDDEISIPDNVTYIHQYPNAVQ
tara:strand:- start:2639 stop:3007 length:369 start_codon:yes stop_codon:yes gene_type:complete